MGSLAPSQLPKLGKGTYRKCTVATIAHRNRKGINFLQQIGSRRAKRWSRHKEDERNRMEWLFDYCQFFSVISGHGRDCAIYIGVGSCSKRRV